MLPRPRPRGPSARARSDGVRVFSKVPDHLQKEAGSVCGALAGRTGRVILTAPWNSTSA